MNIVHIDIKISPLLRLYLNYTNKNQLRGVELIRDILKDEYHKPDLKACVVLTFEMYKELLNNHRFCLPKISKSIEQMLISPIDGHSSLMWPFPNNDEVFNITQFYNCMLNHMYDQMKVANIGWMRCQIKGDEGNSNCAARKKAEKMLAEEVKHNKGFTYQVKENNFFDTCAGYGNWDQYSFEFPLYINQQTKDIEIITFK